MRAAFAFLPAMYAGGCGDVIYVASTAGIRPLPRRTRYAASKIAVLGVFGTGSCGVRVNSLSPGAAAMLAVLRLSALRGFDIDLSARMIAAM